MSATPKKIILDCDPGHDDAVAMLLAWGSPAIELIGVTTVAGNQTIEKVTANALSLARVGDISGVPFAQGASQPLVAKQIIPAEIHGDSGLDGPRLPGPGAQLDPRGAVELIADRIEHNPTNSVTLVPTGTLTNIATFARTYPELVSRVHGVTLMGGAYQAGNMTPVAEFNILGDPEAAKIVFETEWNVTMVGLDVTHKVLATPDRMEQLASVGTDVARFIAELVEFFGTAYKTEHRFPGPPMHDPLAVAAVADPETLRTIAADVHVETTGEFTRGMTVVDLRRTWGPDYGGDPSIVGVADDYALDPAKSGVIHRVGVDVDADKFWQLLIDALRRIGNTNFA